MEVGGFAGFQYLVDAVALGLDLRLPTLELLLALLLVLRPALLELALTLCGLLLLRLGLRRGCDGGSGVGGYSRAAQDLISGSSGGAFFLQKHQQFSDSALS